MNEYEQTNGRMVGKIDVQMKDNNFTYLLLEQRVIDRDKLSNFGFNKGAMTLVLLSLLVVAAGNFEAL